MRMVSDVVRTEVHVFLPEVSENPYMTFPKALMEEVGQINGVELGPSRGRDWFQVFLSPPWVDGILELLNEIECVGERHEPLPLKLILSAGAGETQWRHHWVNPEDPKYIVMTE